MVQTQSEHSLTTATRRPVRDKSLLKRAVCILTRMLLVLAIRATLCACGSQLVSSTIALYLASLRSLASRLGNTTLLQTGPTDDVLFTRCDIDDRLG